MLSVSGLGSGLDIDGMVKQLVAAERAGHDQRLSRQNAEVSAKLSAFSQLKGAVSAFQSSLSSLTSLDSFDNRKASSSDEDSLGVKVSGTPLASSYNIDVERLAQSHALASASFTDKNSATLGTGSLTIRLGTTDYDPGTDSYNGFSLREDSAAVTIDIDENNNSLEGIMQAINDADAGVSASIVHDGGGYRLLLSASDTGAANSLEITVADDDGDATDAAGLSQFSFNAEARQLAQTRAAQDAELTVNGLAVTAASNTVDTLIEGLELSLKGSTTEPVTVRVQDDKGSALAAVKSFLEGYNKFISTANQLSRYDAETGNAGRLIGDFTLRGLRGQVDSVLRNPVPGLSGDITTLFDIGVKTTSSGTLEFDQERFDEVMAEDPGAIEALFAALGRPSDGGISYQEASAATRAGSYAVQVDTLAAAGRYQSAVLPAFAADGSLQIDDDNDNFSIAVDGAEAVEVSLSHGNYASGAALATEMQARINGNAALREAGLSVTVAYDADSDKLSITSASLGSDSSIRITSIDSNSAVDLGLSVASGTPGTDVAGSIGGQLAEGVGDILTGAEGTEMEGLALRIGGQDSGARGEVVFSRGLADQLDKLLASFLEDDGVLDSRIDSLSERSKDIRDRREALESRWEVVEARYRQQFNQLDSLLAQLNSTSSWLTGQLESLSNLNRFISNKK